MNGERSKRQPFNSLLRPIYVSNSVVNTKLPAILFYRCSTTVSLEAYPLWSKYRLIGLLHNETINVFLKKEPKLIVTNLTSASQTRSSISLCVSHVGLPPGKSYFDMHTRHHHTIHLKKRGTFTINFPMLLANFASVEDRRVG